MRVYRPYTEWEDWRAGMYAGTPSSDRNRLAQEAASLLASSSSFYATANEVIKAWPVSTLVNLTGRAGNRRAWVGQAACCYGRAVPEDVTREAWGGLLTDSQRRRANRVADSVIAYWESGLGCQRDIFDRTS